MKFSKEKKHYGRGKKGIPAYFVMEANALGFGMGDPEVQDRTLSKE
jgi:hypothetical protein